MKYLILCSLAVSCFSSFSSASEISVSKIENFPKSYGPHRPKGASRCTGKLDKEKTKSYPWISDQLFKGIDCLVGDFDGDGHTDYILLKNGWTSDASEVGTSEIVALMYGVSGLDKIVLVDPNCPIFSLEIYPPTEKKGPYGEPASKLPGLVEWGEGGETKIWLFNNGKFVKSTFASEND